MAKKKELDSGVFHPAVSAAGFESAPIMSNGLERIDHAEKRGGPMILHELRIVMNFVYRAPGSTSEHTSPPRSP
jgi:hypothetical protein